MATTSIEERVENTEKEIRRLQEELVALRRECPPEAFDDYAFGAWDKSIVRLSELFGDRSELLLIHNMGKSCRFCTLWADGFNGVADHLADRAAFVVVSPDDPKVQQEFAESRDWKFEMVSTGGTTFAKDTGFEKEGMPQPGVSTFRKHDDGRIERVAHARFGPGDLYCSTWHLLDLLPEGEADWEPQYTY